MPFFTIIIPSFNSSGSLHLALSSILQQSFSDFEVLIMDGNSSDNTIELVKSFKDLRIRINSEPDQGVYDAMNKGIEKAKGEWILFLGSDDKLYNDEVLSDIAKVLKRTKKGVVYGDAQIDGNVSWAKGDKIYGGKFSLYRLLRRNICHQAIFYKREFLMKNHLTYNLSYPVSADWDLNLRAWLIQPFQYHSTIISYFTAGGISSGGRRDDFKDTITITYKKYYINPYNNQLLRFVFSIYNKLKLK